jgi:hypothetical protein
MSSRKQKNTLIHSFKYMLGPEVIEGIITRIILTILSAAVLTFAACTKTSELTIPPGTAGDIPGDTTLPPEGQELVSLADDTQNDLSGLRFYPQGDPGETVPPSL